MLSNSRIYGHGYELLYLRAQQLIKLTRRTDATAIIAGACAQYSRPNELYIRHAYNSEGLDATRLCRAPLCDPANIGTHLEARHIL